MKAKTENRLPRYVAIAAITLYGIGYYFGIRPKFTNDLRVFLSMVNDVGAILAGFILSSLAIILSLQDNRVLIGLKQAKMYDRFIFYFIHAAALCLCIVVMNLIMAGAITAEFYLHDNVRVLGLGLWFLLVFYGIGSIFRAVIVFYSVLIAPAAPVKPKADADPTTEESPGGQPEAFTDKSASTPSPPTPSPLPVTTTIAAVRSANPGRRRNR